MDKKKLIGLFIILGCTMVVIFNIYFFLLTGGSGKIIPFTGLEQQIHYSIFTTIWPVLGSIIFVFLFPYILIPIFLKFKNLIWNNYENAYLDISPDVLTISKFLNRSIFIFLLAIGLQITLVPILGYDNFISQESLLDFKAEGRPLQYALDVLAGTTAFLAPFCAGIWAIGWSLEDSGLIHFSLPKSKDYYEIEPIHVKFNSYLGGFAGFSAIIFYLGALSYYIFNPSNILDIFWTVLIVFEIMFLTGPAYLIYSRKSKAHLRKNLNKAKFINKEDLSLE